MLITLFSDASICPDTGCVGWASWAKCDRGTVRAEGILKRQTIDSAVAEAMAAVNGLAMAIRKGLVKDNDSVLIQTDNNSVMDVLQGTVRRYIRRAERKNQTMSEQELLQEVLRRNEEIDEIAYTYRQMVEGYNLTVRWKHCKGHRGLEDKRSAVNSHCDQRAKERMKEARLLYRRDVLPKAA